MEYDWIVCYWLHNISDTLYGAKVVKLTEDKDKRMRELERENSRLKLIVGLQKDIIDSYKELAEIVSNKVVFE